MSNASDYHQREATLHLLNGEKNQGLLMKFSLRNHQLELKPKTGVTQYFEPSEIAYIGFHRPKGKSKPLPERNDASSMLVHTLTTETFHVLASGTKKYQAGFFATADESEPEYSHFFFYNHGVRLFEEDTPLGMALLDEKTITDIKIEEALSTQRNLQAMPLGDILLEQQKIAADDLKKALGEQKKNRRFLGRVLIEANLITEEDLQSALKAQETNRSVKIGQLLIDMGAVTEEQVSSALAKKLHLPFVDLDTYPIKQSAIDEVGIQILHQHQSIPIASDEFTLTLARADPLDFDAFDDIRFLTKKRIAEVVATPSQIKRLLDYEISLMSGDDNEFLFIEQVEEEEPDDVLAVALEAETSPVVRLVNKIFVHALERKASDIHILPQEKKLRVLYRVNGDLISDEVLDKSVQPKIVSRIKILSGMDISEHRITQDGRMRVFHNEAKVEFRVSCIPNIYGESIVMRILKKEAATDLEAIGLRPDDQQALEEMIKKPFGLILSTGPTGSGKSTTLFALLEKIIKSPLHVITIEDPVESEIDGANQIQVNHKTGLTFTSVLRNILRHDPDVIMVGEMRDPETASIGVEAALTGHLMLSTLHTNSAVDTIVRLQDLGVPNYLLAPAVSGIISQTLVKRLCSGCRVQLTDEDTDTLAILKNLGIKNPKKLYQQKGCNRCQSTGYNGRVMVYELLVVTPKVREAIHDKISGYELTNIVLKEGMIPKAQHALELAEAGTIGYQDLIKMLI